MTTIKGMHSRRISRKISVAILLIVIGVLGVFEWYQYTSTERLAVKELNELADRTLARLAQNLELPLWEVDESWVEKVVNTEMEDDHVHAIVVQGEGDISIAKSRDDRWNPVDAVLDSSDDLVERRTAVHRDGDRIGNVSLYISRRFMHEDLREEAVHALTETLFLSIALILFLSLMLQRIVILPLSSMLEMAKTIARGEYAHDVELKQQDEIGLLANEFNRMKDNVHQRETERDNAFAMLAQDKERTKAQLDLTLLSFDNERKLVDFAVSEFVRFTQSKLGYLHFFDSERGTIRAYTWSKGFSDSLETAEQHDFPLQEEGIWADAIRQQHPVIHNDFSQLTENSEMLGERLTLTRHMSVPIISNDQVVGVAGVCDKKEPYTDSDTEILSLYVSTLWYLLEKRHAAEELQQLRRYLQNVIDSMPSVLVAIDHTGSVTLWNQGAEEFSGIDEAAAQGKVVDQVLPLLSQQMHALNRALREGVAQRMERVVHTTDGEQRYADIIAYPLVTNAHVGAVIRIDDVTERVRVEEMMVQTEKMMSVGGLAAGMAHEINNPLGGILQGEQNIRRRFSPEMDKNRTIAEELGLDLEKVQQYMERREILHFMDAIAQSGKRASIIVNNMLHFSRKDEKKQPVDIVGLLDQVLELAAVDYDLKKKYDFRSIEIRRDYEPGLPPIPCNSSEIEQVLLNILRNSAEALQEIAGSGKTPQITVNAHRKGKYVQIDIIDNGPGISEETRRRVFEPFFTTKPPGKGTGLGLSVSYFIVTDTHDGEMTMESEIGKGSKLSIFLPIGK
ncbi:MAG: GAF domain-containing protein [Sedimenticola sp.]